jgi:hypothetical protein
VIGQLTLDLEGRACVSLPDAEAAAIVADFRGRYVPVRGLPGPRCCCVPRGPLVFAVAFGEEPRCALCGREP